MMDDRTAVAGLGRRMMDVFDSRRFTSILNFKTQADSKRVPRLLTVEALTA